MEKISPSLLSTAMATARVTRNYPLLQSEIPTMIEEKLLIVVPVS